MSLDGSLVALATVGALLAAVVTFGVAVSAVSNSTLLGVAVLWVVLYGGGFALNLNWLPQGAAELAGRGAGPAAATSSAAGTTSKALPS